MRWIGEIALPNRPNSWCVLWVLMASKALVSCRHSLVLFICFSLVFFLCVFFFFFFFFFLLFFFVFLFFVVSHWCSGAVVLLAGTRGEYSGFVGADILFEGG